MRLMSLVPAAALILAVSAPASAQEWVEYSSRSDFFTVNFPAQPTVRDITYPTEYGLTLPAHLHIFEDARGRFSVTVVDYANVQKLHADRLTDCKLYPNLCANPWVGEMRGALDYAAWGLMQKAAKVTHYAYYQTDRIEGRRLQLLNADKSQTFVAVHMHENRLYISQGTVPPGSPPPGLIQQSLGFLDANGGRIRYNSPYSNVYPAPTRVQY